MIQNEEDVIEIDIWKLLRACLEKWWAIVGATVLCGILTFIVTAFFITPTYESTIKMYVNNADINVGNLSMSISDMNASIQLVDVYEVILTTKDTLDVVISRAGLTEYDDEDLREMLTTNAVNDTQIFSVTVTNSSPTEAQLIAQTIGVVLPEMIADIIDSADARIVEHAVIPTQKVAPSIAKDSLIGAFIGVILSVAVIVVIELLDSTLKSETDVTEIADLPILSRIPNFKVSQKENQYRATNAAEEDSDVSLDGLCERNNFETSEAYKMLRTKLNLLIPQKFLPDADPDVPAHSPRIIGVTSALRGEGKSTTSINLAYTIAESGSKVCLVEADMRLPNIGKRLGLSQTPGLSNILTGQCTAQNGLQRYRAKNGVKVYVISAGDIPPTPSELLESQSMETTLQALSTVFDVIVVDLPPVTAVTDALSVAPKLTGMLLVVRENYCNKYALTDTLKQLRLAETKLFGVVLNCANNFAGRSKYYNKYYSKYYKGDYRKTEDDQQ